MNETPAYGSIAKKARVEIIPLIDVVFFLLATFVLFTLSLHKLASLSLQLPEAGDIKNVPDTTIYLQASQDGSFLWKQGRLSSYEPLLAEELQVRLASYKQTGVQPRILVIGDGKVSYGAIVRLLDDIRMQGIQQVSIETASP